jgi:hypothetical protein
MAAAASHVGSDRAPGEIALLVVCCAVIVAVAAVVIRRGRAGGSRPRHGLLDVVRAGRQAGAEPDLATDARDWVAGAKNAVVDAPDQVAGARGAATDTPDPVVERAAAVTDTPAAVVAGRDGAGNPRRAAALVAAAVAILLVGGMGAAVFLVGTAHGTATRRTIAAADPAIGQDPAVPGPAAGSPSPGKHHGDGAATGSTGSASGSPPAAGSHSASSASSPAGAGTSSTGTTPPPSPGTLGGLPPEPVQLDQPGVAATVFTTSFTFTAEGGPVSYAISVPSDMQSFYTITVDPASGTLEAGQQATINVEVILVGEGSDPGPPSVTLNPGGVAITFKFPIIRREQ